MNQAKNFVRTLAWLVLVSAIGLYLMQAIGLVNLMPTKTIIAALAVSAVAFSILFLEQNLSVINQWLIKVGLAQNTIKEYLVWPALVALESLIVYLLIIIPAEYLLTEKWLILTRIRADQKTYLLLVVFLLIFLANYFFQKIGQLGRRGWQVIILVLICLLWGNKNYTKYYNRLQEFPKIYSLSSDWSIVGKQITITGKNFGPVWRQGKVLVDNFEMQIIDWSEEAIIADQPHPPKYFLGQMVVKNWRGNTSNGIDFEVRDPGSLNN
jgi:hypothetical protein